MALAKNKKYAVTYGESVTTTYKKQRKALVLFFCIVLCGIVTIFTSQINYLQIKANEQLPRELTSGRRLDVRVQSDLPWHPIVFDLDEVLVDGKKFLPTDFIFPGKHMIVARKKGFEEWSAEVDVPVGMNPFIVRINLISKLRIVKVKVTHDFVTVGEEFHPQQITLGNREISGVEKFKPGNYELAISHPGFATIQEGIEVTPGEGIMEIRYRLQAKQRRLLVDISYDVAPTSQLQEYKIYMKRVQSTDDVFREVHAGDMIPAGEYQVKIEKPAYESYNGRAIVIPDSQAYTFKAKLIAKYVPISVDIKYDVAPGEEAKALGDCDVNLIDGRIVCRNVQHEKRIKPGTYTLEITRRGYRFRENKKKIYIPPSEKTYHINATLHAQPRTLSFGFFDPRFCMFEAEKFFVDGKIARPDMKFRPGVPYQAIIQFIRYKTINTTIVIEPGEGPYAIPLREIVEYKKYHLRIGRKYHDMVVDNIKFPIQIFVDGDLLESHHIIPVNGFNLINYDFYATRNMRAMRIHCGFYYDESSVCDTFEFRDLRYIDASRLLEHLHHLQKPDLILHCMKRLLEDRRDKTKVLAFSKENRQRIMDVLRQLSVDKEDQLTVRRKIMEQLSE